MRPSLFIGLLLFSPLFALSAARSQNLVLITIDTLRADHLGAYGKADANTPVLDALAAKSLFFENAFCQAPLTLPSHTSLMTGRYPYHHGVRENAGIVNARETTLAEILRARGYHTYAFVGGFPLEHRFGLNQGFELYDDAFPRAKNRPLDFHAERSADQVVQAVASVHLTQPFFVWVHFYDPHAPYVHGGYDGEISFVDRQIGILLKRLQSFDPVIAIAGDHGESLGEHGEQTHRIFIYDSTMRVPFWIYSPDTSPRKILQQVRLIDFLPTILAQLKIPAPSNLDGVVLPQYAGATAYMESQFPHLELGWAPLAGLREGSWKYIEAPKPELYDIRNDPQEKRNVIANHQEIAKTLKAALPNASVRNSQSGISAEMADQLASLGYVSGTSNRSESRIDPKDRIEIWNQIERAVDLENNDIPGTIAILEAARKTDPSNPMVLGFLAQKYAETNRIEEAKKILLDVLHRDDRNTLAIYRLATIYMKSGQPAEAANWAGKLSRLEPNNPDAFLLIARSNMRMGRLQKAIENLKASLALDPLDLETRNDLGNLYLQNRQNELAQAQFREVLKSDPRNVQALNGLASFSFQKNEFPAAQRYLDQAFQIDSRDVQTRMNLALLYAKQGNRFKAVELYRQIVASAETPADWKTEALARLKDLE